MNWTKQHISQIGGVEVEEVIAEVLETEEEFPRELFPSMYRSPFSGGDGRWYFKSGNTVYYSGLTGAISASALVNYKFLNKKRVELAFEGVDADEVWGERADYGSCFHLLVSLHERKKLVFSFDNEEWLEVVEEFIRDKGYYEFRTQWIRDLKNDMVAYWKWKRHYNVKVVFTELPVSKAEWKISTPIDLGCFLTFNRQRVFVGVNFKTGAKPFMESYYLQVAMEAHLYNEMVKHTHPQWMMKGSFCWRPTDRRRAPTEYEMSKNCIDLYDNEVFEHIGKGVLLNKLYKPPGSVITYAGGEEDFSYNLLTPDQWLENFNKYEEILNG